LIEHKLIGLSNSKFWFVYFAFDFQCLMLFTLSGLMKNFRLINPFVKVELKIKK